MRKKTLYDSVPSKYVVIPEDPASVTIKLRDNISALSLDDGTKYQADEYVLVLPLSSDIESKIESDFQGWLQWAKTIDFEKTAADVREKRDKLLKESDQYMTIDRIGISLPDTITASTMLTAFRSLISSLKQATNGNMAVYRQALRDITKSEGFPYDVVFPQKPEDT